MGTSEPQNQRHPRNEETLTFLRENQRVFIALDEGEEAKAREIAKMLGGNVCLAKLSAKDANELLKQGATSEQVEVVLNRAPHWLIGASLFRLIHHNGCTVGIDEAERYHNPRDTAMQQIRQLLNSGYKQGMPALRFLRLIGNACSKRLKS